MPQFRAAPPPIVRSVQEQLAETFDLIDIDGDGFVTLEELNQAFKDIGGVSHGIVHHLRARCPQIERMTYDEWESVFARSTAAEKRRILRFGYKLAKLRSVRGVRADWKQEPKQEVEQASNNVFVPSFSSLSRALSARGGEASSFLRPIPFMSPQRLSWDIFMAVLLVYIAITAPYTYAFGPKQNSVCYSSISRWTTKMDLLIDMCFLIDIVLNFFTSYPDKRGNEILDPSRIATNYLKTWFIVDAISTIPLDCISSAMPVDLQPAKLLKLSKITKVFRFVRLSKVVKLSHGSLADTFEDFLIRSSVQNILKIVNILFSSAVICHWLACLMAISGPEFLRQYDDGSSSSCGGEYQLENDNCARPASKWTQPRRYLAALYWALTTMTTVGFGDIIPHSDAERAATMLAMVLGGGFYGFVIAEMSSIVATRDIKTRRFHEKLDTIGAWLEHHELPIPYRERVLRYLRAHYRKRTALDEHAILDDLSPELREELIQHLLPDAIVRNPLFESLPTGTLAHLTPIIFTTVKNTNDYVVRAGSPGEGMFIIATGKALQLGASMLDSSSNHSQVSELDVGDSFGEQVLLGLEKVYSYTVKAVCPLEMHTIPTEEFLKCFKGMPDILERIKSNLIGTELDCFDHKMLATDGHSSIFEDLVYVKPECVQSALLQSIPQMSVLIARELAAARAGASPQAHGTRQSGRSIETMADIQQRIENIEKILTGMTKPHDGSRPQHASASTLVDQPLGPPCLDPLLASADSPTQHRERHPPEIGAK